MAVPSRVSDSVRELPAALGRYVLLRRRWATAEEELYIAGDPEAGLVDVHLLPATRENHSLLAALAALSHPNVSTVLDTGTAGSALYFVEEHVEGVALQALRRHGPLPGEVFLHVVATLASALAAAEAVARSSPQLAVRVPRLGEIFASWAGQLRISSSALLTLSSLVETMIEADPAPAARRPARDSTGLGTVLAELLGNPGAAIGDPAAAAARELAERTAQTLSGDGPGGYRELHQLAVAALRQVVSSPTGEFVSSRLADLIEQRAPAYAAEEAELLDAGALALSTLPAAPPIAPPVEVRSFEPPLLNLYYDLHQTAARASAKRPLRPSLPPVGLHAIGERLPGTPYRLLRRLGAGGMGIVFAAEHVDLNRQVAIKVVRGDLRRDPQMLARFRQEARSAARIHHPGVVAVYDFGTSTAGEPFLVMELLDGRTLSDVLEETQGGLDLDHAVEILRQVCDAVQAAHQVGVIHRDLKPDNIILLGPPVDSAGRATGVSCAVKVLDFGIARIRDVESGTPMGTGTTARGQVVGTPDYMAPEQILAAKVDHRVDIYSLGCIAYEVLTGERPFSGESQRGILAAHIRQRPTPLRERAPERGIPEALDLAVLRALGKEPEDRYSSMTEFAEALSAGLCFPQTLTPLAPEPSVPVVAVRQPTPAGTERAAAASSGGVSTEVRAASSGSLTPTPAATEMQPPSRSASLRPLAWIGLGLAAGLIVSLWRGNLRHAPEVTPPGAALRSGHPLARAPAVSPRQPGHDAAAHEARPPESVPTTAVPVSLLARPPVPLASAEPETPVPPARPAARPAETRSDAEPRMTPRPPGGAGANRSAPPPVPVLAPPAEPIPDTEPPPAPLVAVAAPAPPRAAGATHRNTTAHHAAPPPAPEPPHFRDGRLSYHVLSTTSAYGTRDLARGLEPYRPELQGCYRRSVAASPMAPPSGTGTLAFAISDDGLLSPSSLRVDAALEPLRPCLERALQGARFPRPEIAPVWVSLQLRLEPLP